MSNNCINFLKIIYKKRPITTSAAITVIALVLDLLTGRLIHFPISFIFPVALLAWAQHPKTANTLAIILPLVRIGFYFVWEDQRLLHVAGINALISVTVLLTLSLLITEAAKKRELEKRLKRLEGILPICASCKRIKNEQGEYVPLEAYITRHSQASFTHGICPECAKELYPEFINKKA